MQKARWILDKLELVGAIDTKTIVTGSRIAYLGKHYYTEVIFDPTLNRPTVDFNYSRFRIQVSPGGESQAAIQQTLGSSFG